MSTIYLEEGFWSMLQSSGVISHTPHGAAVVVWGQPWPQTWPKWWSILAWVQHLASFIAFWITFGLAHWLRKFLSVCEELHRCTPSSYTQGSPTSCDQASFRGIWQVSASLVGFATRWRLWFLNFFSFRSREMLLPRFISLLPVLSYYHQNILS